MTLQDLKGKKVYILGYGVEGKATERYLKNKIEDLEIDIGDQSLDENYLLNQKNYDIAIRSPGIQKELITIPHTTATNIFFSEVKGRTIGVTGTKGKSTTASLIHHMLVTAGIKSRLAGNIGTPMLHQLLENNDTDTVWVLELSSYMLDDLYYSPNISVVVSIYNDHLNYHKTELNYQNAKKNIILHQKAEDLFIYNPNFEILKQWALEAKGKAIPYIDFTVSKDSTELLGEHNHENIKAAATVAKQLGISELDMYKALRTFHPLPHRLQKVGTFHDLTFYDDAISTTPESTIAAIEAIGNVGTIFLGGLDRGYDFTSLVDFLIKKNIKTFVFFPDSGLEIKKILQNKGYSFKSIETSSMAEAVIFAYENTEPNMVCLLSTASPSYSVWKNFEEKGDQFQQYVKEYGQKDSQKKDPTDSQAG